MAKNNQKKGRVDKNENLRVKDMMRPMTAQISQSRVKKTWPLMSETGQQDMSQLLREVSLPVLHAIRGDKRRKEFQQVLDKAHTKAQRKFGRLPVPPTTRDAHYKIDKLVQQRDQMEAALLPLLEQIPLLEAEIGSEQDALEQDEAYLEELQKNARSQKNKAPAATAAAKQLLDKYPPREDLEDSVDEINFEPQHTSELNAQVTSHLDKILENTDSLRQLMDSCERLSAVIQPAS